MCPESLEVGQVWELIHNSVEFTPGLLLSLYEENLGKVTSGPDRVARYWRVLDLNTGEVYLATVDRWEENCSCSDLVGRRLL